jgi:hypothetical protein
MSTTARAIITAAFDDIGVLAAGEPMPPELAQDGLERLNRLVSGLQTQPGTSNAVIRYLFPITSNQQTYTIGLGGDFDVPRPEVNDVQGAGLLLQGLSSAAAVTSITRTGYVATVTQTAHGFAVGDEAFIQGANEIDYNGLQTVQTVPTANTYTFTVNGLPTTPATGTITAASIDGQPVEIPRTVITDSAFAAIQLKNMPNAQFTNVYYNPTFPFGQIFLWPRPNTAINQLVLYLNTVFTQFATITREYDWPSLPGYAEMLQYNLGKRLTMPYGRPWTPELEALRLEATGLVKRANNKLNDLPTDASVLTRDPRGSYNINTDQGG